MKISSITYVSRKKHRLRNFLIIIIILAAIGSLAAYIPSAYFGWDLVKTAFDLIDKIGK